MTDEKNFVRVITVSMHSAKVTSSLLIIQGSRNATFYKRFLNKI